MGEVAQAQNKSRGAVKNDSDPAADALTNGEFKLFEKGHGAKKCDCKEGESCAKCKKDDKKAWVPPWKKDGVENAGNSEGAKAGWLTRKGGIRSGEEFDHEDGSGKHVKLTIQGQEDGQKDIELSLPKDVQAAVAAGKWKPNADLEKHSKGEDFHTIHGYELVGGLREKYGKGSEPDKLNGIIGGQLARAKAYYARAGSFDDGSTAQHALKAKAESIIKEVHAKHHPALLKAKAAHTGIANSYHSLLNSFRTGALVNYNYDEQEMLDEVAECAENGDPLPDDLREQYEEWLDENS